MTPAVRRSPLHVLLPVLGCLGFAAAWILLARLLQSQCSWLAPAAALDVAWMLRLGAVPAGRARTGWTLVVTALVIAAANWGIAATEVGRSLGLLPWESAVRLGPAYAWELIRLANTSTDLAWYGVGLVTALVIARR